MRKNTLLFAAAAASAALLCACGTSTGNSSIDSVIEDMEQSFVTEKDETFYEDIAGRIGNHIVYSYNLFEGRKIDDDEKKEMIEYLEEVDAGLKEDIYVTGSARMSFNNSFRFYGRQFTDGILVPDVYYATDFDDPDPNIVLVENYSTVSVPNATGLYDPTELFARVKADAEANSRDLCDYHEKGVYGTYNLCYDVQSGLLVYRFEVNETSYVDVDAKTGAIVKTDYWNGDYID